MTPYGPASVSPSRRISAVSQRLPSARRVEYASDRINRHLGILNLPHETFVRCSRHDTVNSVRRELSELSIDLGPDSSRLIIWGSRAYDDQRDRAQTCYLRSCAFERSPDVGQ